MAVGGSGPLRIASYVIYRAEVVNADGWCASVLAEVGGGLG